MVRSDQHVSCMFPSVHCFMLSGRQVSRLLYSACHLQRVSLALLQILELDTSQVLLIQDRHTGESLSQAAGWVTVTGCRLGHCHRLQAGSLSQAAGWVTVIGGLDRVD